MKKENRLAYIIVAAIFCAIYAVAIVSGYYRPVLISIFGFFVGFIISRVIVNYRNRDIPRVIFCDLDGTLITTKSGKTFPENCNDWQFRLDVIHAIRTYAPTAIHIISNQGGIEKGYINHQEFINKMISITQLMKADSGIPVTFDYCQYNDPNHPYRKPNPGMITFYLTSKSVSARHCLMIGDASGRPGQFSDSDLRCAENAHIKYLDVDDFVHQYNPIQHA